MSPLTEQKHQFVPDGRGGNESAASPHRASRAIGSSRRVGHVREGDRTAVQRGAGPARTAAVTVRRRAAGSGDDPVVVLRLPAGVAHPPPMAVTAVMRHVTHEAKRATDRSSSDDRCRGPVGGRTVRCESWVRRRRMKAGTGTAVSNALGLGRSSWSARTPSRPDRTVHGHHRTSVGERSERCDRHRSGSPAGIAPMFPSRRSETSVSPGGSPDGTAAS